MRLVIAIDPGPEESAVIAWNGVNVVSAVYDPNPAVIQHLRESGGRPLNDTPLVIEKIASYGMAVGAEVFETVFWSGRFAEAYGFSSVHRVTRGEVKMHLCHSMRAKDGNVRQALLDRFGGKEKAVGKKASPGALYGISGDLWAALAVAVTFWDTHQGKATWS